MIIAIDGPSGVGKSTLSKLLAREMGYVNLDTGAMYRVVALAAHRRGIDPNDGDRLGALSESISIEFVRQKGEEKVLLDGDDVSREIRTPEISLLTPQVASQPSVREAMVRLQRAMGEQGGVVLEGRDIGTVVFPGAELKFFLEASADVRGRRRFLELQAKGMDVDLARTVADVEARDAADSNRSTSPLRRADDALAIDTSELEINQVLDLMLENARLRREALCTEGQG